MLITLIVVKESLKSRWSYVNHTGKNGNVISWSFLFPEAVAKALDNMTLGSKGRHHWTENHWTQYFSWYDTRMMLHLPIEGTDRHQRGDRVKLHPRCISRIVILYRNVLTLSFVLGDRERSCVSESIYQTHFGEFSITLFPEIIERKWMVSFWDYGDGSWVLGLLWAKGMT